MLEIHNYPKTFKIKKSVLINALEKGIKKQLKLENVSVIFVSIEEIQRLNKEYREVDTPTDVLSFNYNTFDILGEVYICLEYIEKNRNEIPILEEIVRLIVHGILHLYDYEHENEFIDSSQPDLENMFVIQERMVNDIMKIL